MTQKKRAAVPKVVVADRRIESLYAKVKADLVATRKKLRLAKAATLRAVRERDFLIERLGHIQQLAAPHMLPKV